MRCLSIRKLKTDFFSSSVRGNHGGGEGVLQDSPSVLKKRIYKQIRRSSYHMSWTRLGELMWATEHIEHLERKCFQASKLPCRSSHGKKPLII